MGPCRLRRHPGGGAPPAAPPAASPAAPPQRRRAACGAPVRRGAAWAAAAALAARAVCNAQERRPQLREGALLPARCAGARYALARGARPGPRPAAAPGAPAAAPAARRRARRKKAARPAPEGGDAAETPPRDALREVLRREFGHEDFRGPRQEEAVRAVLQGRDAMVMWATGSGKSLVYQLPALATNRTVVVISPLISLMQDQVSNLNRLVGREVAVFAGSMQTDKAKVSEALEGKYLLLYASPEFLNLRGLDNLRQLRAGGRLCAVAVDEAHCVEDWADFRPEYKSVCSRLRDYVGDAPILALTATAKPQQRQRIADALRLQPGWFESVETVLRPNLRLEVERKTTSRKDCRRIAELMAEAADAEGQAIVYVRTVKEADSLLEKLSSLLHKRVYPKAPRGLRGHKYHASMSAKQRDVAFRLFQVGAIDFIVATIAFGMGIDKPNVRCIVHYGPPNNIALYYQQCGRAGRDGLKARCVLLWRPRDMPVREHDVGELWGYVEASSARCRQQFIGSVFEESLERCGECDLCQARGDDEFERDFTAEARLICQALEGFNAPVTRKEFLERLEDCRTGGEDKLADPAGWLACQRLASEVRDPEICEGLLAPLHDLGYIERSVGQRGRGLFEMYQLKGPGRDLLDLPPGEAKISLSPPFRKAVIGQP